MSARDYVGRELDIFALASNWKRYYGSFLRPHFGARVLEVGAGIGATTTILHDGQAKEWVCLEPDKNFVNILEKKIQTNELPSSCKARPGSIKDLEANDLYDSILYIDVLEHIEDDRAEIQLAASHLESNGRLIVLSPAHQFLFTPFDQAIGHFRRYSKATLEKIHPQNCPLEKLIYLDSAGMALSLANKMLLRQSMPTESQILFWDRWIIPVSRVMDRVLMYRAGKSILGIWKRD